MLLLRLEEAGVERADEPVRVPGRGGVDTGGSEEERESMMTSERPM